MAKVKHVHDNDELTAYYNDIYAQIEATTSEDPYGKYVLSRVKGGQKTVFNKTQTEIRNFDMSFLDVIESVYPAILKIMRDPKKSIRYEEEIVAVEKARKVNSQTVRHLSSHTQLIKEITKEGDVIPSKVLTTFAEEEIAIYENRFIKSLVKRIEMFLERRYEVMKVSLESFENQRLNVVNEFLMSGQTVTVNLDISIKNDLTTDVKTTKEQYNRLLYVREIIQGLKGTEFMRALAKAKDVLPPIMKTNIILHNPDFKLCYGLWLYLDRVDGISTNVDIKEKTYKYSPAFDKDINSVMALAVTAFIRNREIEGIYASKNLPTVKAPKPQVNDNIQLEMNFEADNKKLEDYTMNQILLDETAKFFEAAHEGIRGTSMTLNESIRVVYRQMLDMLDQIYPRTFGVSDEELESKNVYEQLEYARRKMMVFKIVRQQKQMNIARMGKQEKDIERTIKKIEEKVKVFEEQERLRLEKQRQKEEAIRQAAIERERKEEERKRKLEDEAIRRQKEIERQAQVQAQAVEGEDDSQRRKRQKAYELALKNRLHLKEVKYYVPEVEEEVLPEEEVQEEQVIYVDEFGNEIEAPQDEEIVYVDEDGNELTAEQVAQMEAQEEAPEEVAEEVVEEESQPTEEDLMADEYEQMLRDSGLSDEEIAAMLGEIVDDESQAEEVLYVDEDGNEIPAEELAQMASNEEAVEEVIEEVEPEVAEEVIEEALVEEEDEYLKMLKESGLSDEELALLAGIEEPKVEETLEETVTDDYTEDELAAISEIAEKVEEEIVEEPQNEPLDEVLEEVEEEVQETEEMPLEGENEPIDEEIEEVSTEEVEVLEEPQEEIDEALEESDIVTDEEPQEEVIYVDEDGNEISPEELEGLGEPEEEVIYVDEDGNEISAEELAQMDEYANLTEDEIMVLEYEKMLAESNMSPEEFDELVQLSGIPELEAEQERIEEEQQELMADEYLEMLRDSGLSEEELAALLGED